MGWVAHGYPVLAYMQPGGGSGLWLQSKDGTIITLLQVWIQLVQPPSQHGGDVWLSDNFVSNLDMNILMCV